MSHKEKPVLEGVSKEIENILLDHGFVWSHGVRNRNVYKHESGSATITYGDISFTCSNYKYTPRSVYTRGTYVLTEKEASSIERKLNMMKKKTQEMKDKEAVEVDLANKECERIKSELTDIMENIAMGKPFEVKTKVKGVLKKFTRTEVVYQGFTLNVTDTDNYLVSICVNKNICQEVSLKKAFRILDLMSE